MRRLKGYGGARWTGNKNGGSFSKRGEGVRETGRGKKQALKMGGEGVNAWGLALKNYEESSNPSRQSSRCEELLLRVSRRDLLG